MTEKNNKVLVVDDQSDIRFLLREFLSIEGYSVVLASNGDQAVEMARSEKPSLILMDIMMPIRDGLSAVQEIRAEDSIVGIIVLTAFSTEQSAIRALQVGADDYMHKPFDPLELRAKVTSVLERCVLRKENKRLHERLAALLEHYMPPSIAQSLIDAPEMPHLGGERQVVTTLFADLRGFTDFSSVTPPEELIRYLNSYLAVVANSILQHNGTVDKFLGDGVMALFNVPRGDDNHLANAVRAALSIHQQVEHMHIDSDRVKLQFGVGIHTGEAVVGNIGTANLMDYTAVGDSVNMAKRLEEYARPGQTLVSQAVVNQLGDRVMAKALEPIKVKGRIKPEPVFEVETILDSVG